MSVGLPVLGGTTDYTLDRYTVNGGGAMRSSGGDFELSSTIGQPDVGVLAGGDYELQSGFWFALIPGDFDEDGVVTLLDYLGLGLCFTGPGTAVSLDCVPYDTNGNGTIDLLDVAQVQAGFNGF